jgi:hypothetical protein
MASKPNPSASAAARPRATRRRLSWKPVAIGFAAAALAGVLWLTLEIVQSPAPRALLASLADVALVLVPFGLLAAFLGARLWSYARVFRLLMEKGYADLVPWSEELAAEALRLSWTIGRRRTGMELLRLLPRRDDLLPTPLSRGGEVTSDSLREALGILAGSIMDREPGPLR